MLTYNVIFALNWGMVACNAGAVGHTITFGINSCKWDLIFFVLETLFFISALVVFFKKGPGIILKEMWDKRGKVALLLVVVALVVGTILMGVLQLKRAQYPELHPGPWYNIL